MPYTTQIKVRGYHLDVYGHVNNARYLEFMEEARWQLVEENLDLDDFARRGLGFAVVNIDIDYRRPAGLGDVLEIHSDPKHLGGKSGVLHQRFLLAGSDTVVAEADVTFVVIDVASGRAVALDGDLRRALEAADAETP